MATLGRALFVIGGMLIVVGVLLSYGHRLPFRLGQLPLDFRIHRENFSFYFPLGTSILVSVVLTLVFGLLSRK